MKRTRFIIKGHGFMCYMGQGRHRHKASGGLPKLEVEKIWGVEHNKGHMKSTLGSHAEHVLGFVPSGALAMPLLGV